MNPYTVTPYLRDYAFEPAQAPEDLTWQDLALCAEVDGEIFFPEKGGSTREAKRTCRACEVRPECLEYALDHQERWGIWGGMSERERHRLTRERQNATTQPRKEAALCASSSPPARSPRSCGW